MDRIEAWQEISNHMTGIFSNRHSPSENNALLTKMSSTLARCTSCGLCATICESGISTAPLWGSMRGACSEMGFKEPLVEKNSALILRKKNPNDGEISSRTAWIPPSVHIADSAPIGYFPGCTIAFRQPELGKAVLRVLHQAGVSFCMLGNDEFCCGSFLFRTGFEEEYGDTIREMIKDLENRGVKPLLVSCAGFLKTITLNWPRVYGKDLPFQAVSFSVFIRDLIKEKILYQKRTSIASGIP